MDCCAKNLRDYKCRVFELSSSIWHQILEAIPIVLFFLFLITIVYKFFLPYLCHLLIRSLPVFVCTAIILRFLVSYGHSENQRGREIDKDGRRIKPVFGRPHSVRRRHANEKIRAEDGREGKEENGSVLLSTTFDDLVSRTALMEENRKDLLEDIVKVDGEDNVVNDEKTQTLDEDHPTTNLDQEGTDVISRNGYDEWLHRMNGPKGESDGESQEEDEEGNEAHKHRNMAVEWTEDDEKNLMDLGLSEIERNKRLESLIAKRRARKLSKKNLAPNLVARTKPLNGPGHSSDTPTSPGSAPSVLLPMHNPFDLPYDPQEEKPNLTGDSFHQEFMAAYQKDMSFCRHESFSFGPSFSVGMRKRQHENKFSPYSFAKRRASGNSRLRKQFDKKEHEKFVTGESPRGSQFKALSDNADLDKNVSKSARQIVDSPEQKHGTFSQGGHRKMDTKQVCKRPEREEDGGDMSSPSSPSEGNKANHSLNKDRVFTSVDSSSAKDSERGRTELDRTSCLLKIGKTRDETHLSETDNVSGITPTYSIASDLQVEVSEAGSPSFRNDWQPSPTNNSLMYDGDAEKEITSGSEWGQSPYLSGVEENGTRSREVHELNEDDNNGAGSPRPGHNSGDSISSPLELVVEQYPETKEPKFHSQTSGGKSCNDVGVMSFSSSSTYDAKPPIYVVSSQVDKKLKDHENGNSIGYVEGDTASPNEHKNYHNELKRPVESNGSSSSNQQGQAGRCYGEVVIPEVDYHFRNPISSAPQPSSAVPRYPIDFVHPSPTSVLLADLVDQQSDAEDAIISNSSRELSGQNIAPMSPQRELEVLNSQHSSADESEMIQEHTVDSEKFFENANELSLSCEKEIKLDPESLKCSQSEAHVFAEPLEGTCSRYTEDARVRPEERTKTEARTGRIEQITGENEIMIISEDSNDSREVDAHEDFVQKQQQADLPDDSIASQFTSVNPNVNVSVVEEEASDNTAKTSEIGNESVLISEKVYELEPQEGTCSRFIEDVCEHPGEMTIDVAEAGDSTKKANSERMRTSEDLIDSKKISENVEDRQHQQDIELPYTTLTKLEAIGDQSKSANSSASMVDSEEEASKYSEKPPENVDEPVSEKENIMDLKSDDSDPSDARFLAKQELAREQPDKTCPKNNEDFEPERISKVEPKTGHSGSGGETENTRLSEEAKNSQNKNEEFMQQKQPIEESDVNMTSYEATGDQLNAVGSNVTGIKEEEINDAEKSSKNATGLVAVNGSNSRNVEGTQGISQLLFNQEPTKEPTEGTYSGYGENVKKEPEARAKIDPSKTMGERENPGIAKSSHTSRNINGHEEVFLQQQQQDIEPSDATLTNSETAANQSSSSSSVNVAVLHEDPFTSHCGMSLSTEERNVIDNFSDPSGIDDPTHPKPREAELRRLPEQQVLVEPSLTEETTNSTSTDEVDQEFIRAVENEPTAVKMRPRGEDDKSNSPIEAEGREQVISHENAADLPKPNGAKDMTEDSKTGPGDVIRDGSKMHI